jgi:small subunit ribosomal protein S4
MVRHGNVLVNGKRVDIPSYRVAVGDKISLVNKEVVDKEAFKQVIVPSWLNLDKEKMQAEVVQLPKRDAIDYEVNEKLIVEFYSR